MLCLLINVKGYNITNNRVQSYINTFKASFLVGKTKPECIRYKKNKTTKSRSLSRQIIFINDNAKPFNWQKPKLKITDKILSFLLQNPKENMITKYTQNLDIIVGRVYHMNLSNQEQKVMISIEILKSEAFTFNHFKGNRTTWFSKL